MRDYSANMNALINGNLNLSDGGGGGGEKKVAPLYLPADTSRPIKIEDKRKVLAASGTPFSEKYSKAGSYDQNFIVNVIKAAKHNGVDPNLALAVALQETNMGRISMDQVVHQYVEDAPKGIDQGAYELTKVLRDKMKEGKSLGFKDEAHMIQMFNGMGKLYPGLKVAGKYQPQRLYGIMVTGDTPLDMKKNPVYGRTIQDLRDNVIKGNETIQQLIKGS